MAFMRDKTFFYGAAAMAAVLALSNTLVRYPFVWFEEWLTWAAFSFPLAFLVTDCVNRAAGVAMAQKVVAAGFVVGVPLSFAVNVGDGATVAARIALASGVAFACAQLLDVKIFSRLRHNAAWWLPPMASSAPASLVDTFLFFGLAFFSTGVPWLQLAVGDLAVKILMILLLLPPYRLLTFRMQTA